MIVFSLAKKLDEIKTMFQLNDEELAAKLGVERMTLYRWRTGKSQPHTANWASIARLHKSCATKLLDELDDLRNKK